MKGNVLAWTISISFILHIMTGIAFIYIPSYMVGTSDSLLMKDSIMWADIVVPDKMDSSKKYHIHRKYHKTIRHKHPGKRVFKKEPESLNKDNSYKNNSHKSHGNKEIFSDLSTQKTTPSMDSSKNTYHSASVNKPPLSTPVEALKAGDSHKSSTDNFTSFRINKDSRKGHGNKFDLNPYLHQIRKEIEKHIHYPLIAQIEGMEGTVYVNFYIASNGKIKDLKIKTSSGSHILDGAAIKSIKSIKEFPRPPSEMEMLNITIPITFKLENIK